MIIITSYPIQTWLSIMSFCPICDELIVDKDVFALGCGHLLCDACLTQLMESDRIKECPLCKKCIYQSEIRKIFLNTANDNCFFLLHFIICSDWFNRKDNSWK